jgi:hypothetical protein
MATNEKRSHKAAVKGKHQTHSTTLDDLHDSEHFHSAAPSPLRSGFTDHQEGKHRQACRVHAFGYARRIVLSAMTGQLDGEGLFFDVVGLRQRLAEGVRLSATKTPADTRSVRLFSYNGPMEVVVSRFCVEVQGLCSPGDIPNPPTTDGLHQWAAETQRIIRIQFSGLALETLRRELDAVADRLVDPQS